MRWLVLGASGFIGRHLMARLRADGHDLKGTANRRSGDMLVHFNLEHGTLAKTIEPSWLRDSIVVHCMAHGSIDQCSRDRDRTRAIGVDASVQLINELARLQAYQVYLSTNHVFDGLRGGYREEDECRPINEYGRQKLAVEQFLANTIPGSLTLRLDKVIGGDLSDDTVLAPWWRAIQQAQAVHTLAEQTFTPVFIDDVVRTVVELAQKRATGVYHVGGPSPITRTELATEFCRASKTDATIVEQTAEQMGLLDARPKNASLDITKLRTELNFVPMSPREIVAEFVRRCRISDQS